MEVILTTDIPKLGNAGDVVRVRDGYGRNYLLPQGMALLATKGRVADLEHKRRVIEEIQKKEVSVHQGTAERLSGVELRFEVQAGEEGKLFGSVTTQDIHRALGEQGFQVDRRRIDLAEPIKQTGRYDVNVRLHREVQAQIAVEVVSIGGEAAPEAAEPEFEDRRVGTADVDEYESRD